MPWPPEIAAELPAPRDDEPPGLREAIVKELRDHLECAYRRELVRSGGEQDAARRALQKFGDPAQLARKLWLDAMKEKIMSQRVFIMLASLMTIACLSIGGVAWWIAARAAETSRELLEHSREANAALIEKLGTLATAGQADPEWSRVKIALTKDTPDGPPAAGYLALVSDRPGRGSSEHVRIDETATPEGILDCGLLQSRTYYVTVTTPWSEWMTQEIYVRAGMPAQTFRIVCPGELREAEVTFDVAWPDDLGKRDLGIAFEFRREPRELHGMAWSLESKRSSAHFLLMRDSTLVQHYGQFNTRQQRDQHVTYLLTTEFDRSREAPVAWPAGKCSLRFRGVVIPIPEERRDGKKAFRVIPAVPYPDHEQGIFQSLELKPGEPNVVRIPLSDDLLTRVRAALNEPE